MDKSISLFLVLLIQSGVVIGMDMKLSYKRMIAMEGRCTCPLTNDTEVKPRSMDQRVFTGALPNLALQNMTRKDHGSYIFYECKYKDGAGRSVRSWINHIPKEEKTVITTFESLEQVNENKIVISGEQSSIFMQDVEENYKAIISK